MNALRHIFTHWLTSSAGLGLGIWQVVLNGRSTSQLLLAVATLLVGLIAKDPHKS